ncbi:rod shape-determining protein MreC [Taibaiella chishuiensis]|uniref:Cell shape-determining protein MreC n=1 Tax=Taibaiella chishuiensis TaxID=1434707 RepID=A0A2P8DCD6_9BACT|nr:rod shape-determining protein MreC [Taibaiella chishuiensis]PSK94883.1 rod shape-determining protein MreC [Taibaiella chishuiensis]
MRNFLILIRRFWNLILFLILEVVSLALISKNRNMQGVDIVSSSNSVVGYMYKKQNDVVYYFQLKQMNDSLLTENARLRNAIAQVSNIDQFRDSTVRIPITVRDTSKKDSINTQGVLKTIRYAQYNYIPARVINNSISNDKINFITINRGASDGVQKDMAVVSGNGVVGRVANVSAHYARVVSVLSDRKISSKLPDGTSNLITIWNPGSPEYVVTEKVPVYIKVKKGDSVYTTGYSFFPENVLIGTVAKVDTMKASSAKNLKVRLSTNFRSLQYVYVVDDKMGAEKKQVEAETAKPAH